MKLAEKNSWILLGQHAKDRNLDDNNDIKTSTNSILTFSNLKLNYTHQNIGRETLELLLNLAQECGVSEKISALMNGNIVNQSQKQPALHSALRTMDEKPLLVNGRDIIPGILQVREQMRVISEKIRAGSYYGYSGKPIKSIVNIGMGGSDFGPRFCINALFEYTQAHIDYHFVSDIDPNSFNNAVKNLNPETTLFIISSKSFNTHETLSNAKKAMNWMGKTSGLKEHFIAVTANTKKATELGFTTILRIWDWVGGRFSFCSAINLITCIAIGYEAFIQLLAGAHSMDVHFSESNIAHNMPVLLALIGLWNINFLNNPSLLMLVYARQLEFLVPYIQQLDMESNGKFIDNNGSMVNYSTGPIVWGGLGNQAQHSYYQLLCQSNHKIAADFISIEQFHKETINYFCYEKIQVLSNGVGSLEIPYEYIKGGIPINHLSISSCTPYNLGLLIALYEHKIYTQSILWNINAFDQPGVESAKKLIKTSEIDLALVT